MNVMLGEKSIRFKTNFKRNGFIVQIRQSGNAL